MSNRIKVALINHECPPIPNGIGSYTFDLAKNLSNKKIKVIIITGSYDGNDSVQKINNNLKIYRIKTPNKMPRFLWFQLFNRRKIKRILKEEKVNLLHGQSESSAFLLNNFVFKGKKIITMHGTAWRVSRELLKAPIKHIKFKDALIHIIGFPLWYFLENKEIKNSDELIAFNLPLVESIKKEYSINKKVIIIPQGMDLEKINSFQDKNFQEDKSIFFAGRLVWIKGITYLLEAFKQVNNELPELKLKIFGDGPLKKFISKFARKNNLEDKIILYGFLTSENLIKEIQKSYFGVFPSLIEAESVAMLETMSCKKPLVVFNLPFIRNTLNKENALLCNKDVTSLAKSIKILIKNKRLREKLGKNAYELINNKHEWRKIADRYIDVYEEVLREHNKKLNQKKK